MRTLRVFLAAGVMTGSLAPSAAATPLTLQYDVTITGRCERSTGLCSTVSIGGLNLTVTTDDTLVNQNLSSTRFRGDFGPSTMTIDTSRLGDFASPFSGGSVMSYLYSAIDNYDYGFSESTWARIGDTYEQVVLSGDGPETREYLVYRTLELLRYGVPDGIPTRLTSADVGVLLAQDLLFSHSVRAKICPMAQSENCTFDPRSFDAYGVARFRGSSIPPVPEPATVVLFSLGLAAIARTRRRRRSKMA